MGTVMNGNVWAGACVNGKVVSGLAKDGSVFYRKPVSKYKRRIMVGDDLSARTIFQDFPDNFYKNDISYGSTRNIVISNDVNVYEYMNEGGFYEIMCGNSYIYRYDLISGTVFSKQDVNVGSYPNANVTAITENEAYRHLFIEDSGIRPFQVGDVISENTKIYFVIPDNIGLSAINTMNPGKYTSNPVSFENNNVQIYGQISGSTYKVIFKASKDYTIYSSNFTNVSSNLSKFVPDSGTSFSATVSSINTDSYLYEYILVDKTTLG